MPHESGEVVTEETVVSQPRVGRVVLASFVGTMIEWYDFFLFGTATALVFDRLFFPLESEFASRIAAFGTFAVGFLCAHLAVLSLGTLVTESVVRRCL